MTLNDKVMKILRKIDKARDMAENRYKSVVNKDREYCGENVSEQVTEIFSNRKRFNMKLLAWGVVPLAALAADSVMPFNHYSEHKEDVFYMDLSSVDEKYNLSISDMTDNPFLLSDELVRIANAETTKYETEMDRAKALFKWIDDNIDYSRSDGRGYRQSLEVLRDNQGNCLDMAVMYTAMARAVGLSSNCVDVEIDHSGKEVNHACAGVHMGEGLILVDPAYHSFDIKHRGFREYSDAEFLEHWNNHNQKNTR